VTVEDALEHHDSPSPTLQIVRRPTARSRC
jgi:hypothetical protein